MEEELPQDDEATEDEEGSEKTPSFTGSQCLALLTKVLFHQPVRIDYTAGANATYFQESLFVLDCLKWHNLYRNRHSSPPLCLSYQLCELAQNWANHLAHTDNFFHRNPHGVGGNLFFRWTTDGSLEVKAKEVVDHWYSSIRLYNFNAQPELLHVNAGPFSQLVWRSSNELGVGKARSRTGKLIAVAYYRPAARVSLKYHENVLPPRDDFPTAILLSDSSSTLSSGSSTA